MDTLNNNSKLFTITGSLTYTNLLIWWDNNNAHKTNKQIKQSINYNLKTSNIYIEEKTKQGLLSVIRNLAAYKYMFLFFIFVFKSQISRRQQN